ncbi:hypothetical protein RIF29_30694 [Crotalaria pallida]|uniref:DUF295 domain-containing protein n=1 Tax=Crotalaria pallida TaxID=3830 RepID=A0AAN9HUT6_CROPI
MELILQKLTLMNYFKCRKVCQSWRTKVNDALSTEGRCPPKPHFPFLLCHPYAPDLPLSLLSLTENRLYSWPTQLDEEHLQSTQEINEYHYAYQVSSVDGWLFIQDFYIELTIGLSYGLICFYNPVSNAILKLPKLSFFSGHDQYQTYCSSKLVVSSEKDRTDSITVILVLIKGEGGQLTQHLSFCKVTNNSWTRIEIGELVISDIVIHGCKLYAITKDELFEFVMVFDLSNHNVVTSERLVCLDSKQRFIFHYFELYDGLEFYMNEEEPFLVRDSTCGELLLVLCKIKCDSYVTWPKGFRIFKLDMSGPRWLKVEHMNDRIMLLDETGIQVISATNLDGPLKSIRDNCVYFSLANKHYYKYSFPKHNIGVFSLINNSVTDTHDHSDLSFQASYKSLWFSPSLL